MSLPIYNTQSKDLTLLQTNWASQLDPVINQPINQGHILKNVSLLTGTNLVNHLLQRNLQGWFIVRQRSAGLFYDTQDSNQMSQLYLKLVSDSNVSVDIFVF